MATGTGKTYTAFQIIWRLWKAGRKKRILFLADRNVLIDQTMVNDFRPFGAAMAKLSTGRKTIERDDGTDDRSRPRAIDKKRRIDTAYEIYLGLYQAITGPEERQKLFREFSPGFFDLIVDRRVPPRQRRRGFRLARDPRVLLRRHADRPDRHAEGDEIRLQHPLLRRPGLHLLAQAGHPATASSRPTRSSRSTSTSTSRATGPRRARLDREGEEVEDRIYNQKDFDRTLVIDDRTKLVAKRVTEFLKESGDRFQKTIVFCVDQEHAARMRQALVNENTDLVAENQRYVMRITGNDTEGQDQLGNFIDPEGEVSRSSSPPRGCSRPASTRRPAG